MEGKAAISEKEKENEKESTIEIIEEEVSDDNKNKKKNKSEQQKSQPKKTVRERGIATTTATTTNADDDLIQVSVRDKANFISKFTLEWLTPLVWKGFKRPLKLNDMPFLPRKYKTNKLRDKFEKAYGKYKGKKNAFVYATLELTWFRIVLSNFLYSFVVIIQLLEPFCQRIILENLFPNDSTEEWQKWQGTGYITVGVLCILMLIKVILIKLNSEVDNAVFVEQNSILYQCLFEKIIKLSTKSMAQTNDRSFVTLLTVEIGNVSQVSFSLKNVISIPLLFIGAFIMLFVNVSWVGFTIIAVMVIALPAYMACTTAFMLVHQKLMENISLDSKLLTEILQGIRVIKVNVWENAFMNKMKTSRKGVLKYIFFYMLIMMVVSGVGTLTPILMQIVMFTITFFAEQNSFTLSRVYPSLSYVQLLAASLLQIPVNLMTLTRGIASFKNINTFLELEEKKSMDEEENVDDSIHIKVKDALFKWPSKEGLVPIIEAPMNKQMRMKAMKEKAKKEKEAKKKEKQSKKEDVEIKESIELEEVQKIEKSSKETESELFELRDLNLTVEKGKRLMVFGKVGSGKSTLLNSLVNEMEPVKGKLTVKGTISFAPQKAWIQSASVLNNITFGNKYEEDKLNKVLDSCSLHSDLDVLKDGIKTEIGEKGVNLSGGQKMRINIARCAYNESDIYIFDDVFASVDPQVSNEIFKDVILDLMKEKTVILVTNNLNFFKYADKIIVMDNMKIVEEGKYKELLEKDGGLFSKTMKEFLKHTKDDEKKEEKEKEKKIGKAKKKDNAEQIIEKEEIEEGAVKMGTFWWYFKHFSPLENTFCSIITLTLFVLLLTFSSLGPTLPSLWLTVWITNIDSTSSNSTDYNSTDLNTTFFDNSTTTSPSSSGFLTINGFRNVDYLWVYIGLGLLSPVFLVLKFFVNGIFGIFSGYKIYKEVGRKLLNAPLRFFQTTPLGRILNRMSRDQLNADIIMISLETFFSMIFTTLFSLVILGVSNPITLAPIILFLPIMIIVLEFYRRSARQVNRVFNTVLSPLASFFQECIDGIKTIRSYGKQKEFININFHNIDDAIRAFYTLYNVEIWVSLRINFLNFIVFAASCVIIVTLARLNIGVSTLSAIGISSIFQTSLLISNLLQRVTQVETMFNSIERLKHYAENLPSEPPIIPSKHIGKKFPSNHSIEFKNVDMRYREKLPLVLKKVNFEIRENEKIGIVGRTGSGKSTLFEVLLRTFDPEKGSKVLIGKYDILQMNLDELRRTISIIPQNPYLFNDSIKYNLDPEGKYTDEELWYVLEKCQLKEHIEKLEKKLDAPCKFSVGQSQLICLARSMLQKKKIILLDEATANIDHNTELILQKTIDEEFKDTTMLVIAHRINTIAKSDLILVMEKGEVAEYGTPRALVRKKESLFLKSIRELGKEQCEKILEVINGIQINNDDEPVFVKKENDEFVEFLDDSDEKISIDLNEIAEFSQNLFKGGLEIETDDGKSYCFNNLKDKEKFQETMINKLKKLQ